MAAAAASGKPTTDNDRTAPIGNAGGDSGPVPINQKYVASTDGSLPPVWYLDSENDEQIREWSKTDRDFWLKTYGAARQAQTDQSNLLESIRKLEIKRQAEHGFKVSMDDFRKGTKEMQELWTKFYKHKTELENINKKISAKRRADHRPLDFGLVRSYPLLKPVLGDQTGWQVIEGASHIQYAVSELLGKAYDLQLYRNDYFKAVENGKEKAESEKKVLYDHTYEEKITVALCQINEKLSEAVTAAMMATLAAETPALAEQLKAKPKLLNVHPCVQGDPLMDLEDPDCEPPEEDDFDDKELESGMYYKDPNDPVLIEERGSGPNGQSDQTPLPKEIYDIRCRMGGDNGPLQNYIFGMIHGQENLHAKQQLNALGEEVDAYCRRNSLHNKTYQLTWESIFAFAEIIKEALDIIEAIKADTADVNAQNNYLGLRTRAAWFLESTQFPPNFLDALAPSEAEVTKLVNDHFKAQQNRGSMNVDDKTHPPKPTVEDESDEETSGPTASQSNASQPKPPQPKPSQPKPSQPKPTQPKPSSSKPTTIAPPADSDDQFVDTSSTPGIVMEMKGKTNVMKRISGYRETGRGGHQLLLKSQGTNPDFKNRYIYELVASRKFGVAREEYLSIGGKKMATAGPKFLKEGNKLWSQAKIGGVAPVRRDPEKDYTNETTTYILIKFVAESAVWIARTYLEFRFGAAQVQAQMLQYMMEAGQARSKRPTLTRKPRKSKSKSKSNKDSISVEEDNHDDDEEEDEDASEDFSDIIDDSGDINSKANKMENEMLNMKKMMDGMREAMEIMAAHMDQQYEA